MSYAEITFSSVTRAMEGKKLLAREGITAALRRTPESLRQRGCGYSLRVAQGRVQMAKNLLQRHEIPYQRIFTEQDGGKWPEVIL